MKEYSELYEWFQKDIMKPAVIRKKDLVNTIIRVPYNDDFDFIYHQENYNGQPLTPEKMSYRGVYNKLNGQLYDLQYPLSGLLNKIDSGKDFGKLMLDYEKDVREKIEALVDANIDSLEGESFRDEKYDRRLHDFAKNDAGRLAGKMFLGGQLCEEVYYQCDFTLRHIDAALMLRYLQHPDAVVEEAVNNYWLNNKDDILLELRKNDVLREKLRAIEADTENPLHKQLAIINAIKVSGAKNVNVTVEKDGQRCSFKYSADRLSRYANSDYGTWEMPPKDHEVYESCFGRYSSFHPEDISEITYRGKTIYEVESLDDSEDEGDDICDDESEDCDEGFTMSM